MPDKMNPNGSGAQDALHDDQAAEAATDAIKDKLKGKIQKKGSDVLAKKFGNPNKGRGGAENPDHDDGEKPNPVSNKLNPLGSKGKPGSMRDITKKTAMAGQAASNAVKVGILMKIMGFIKAAIGVLQQAAAAVVSSLPGWFVTVMNFLLWAGHTIGSACAAAGGFFSSCFSGLSAAIANAMGVGSVTATAMAAGAVGAAGMSSIVIIGGVIMCATDHKYDGMVRDCRADVQNMSDAMGKLDPNAMKLANAKKIYSAMKTFGLSDEQVAGILGNWDVESQLDPTIIEGIFSEPYDIKGPEHQDAMHDWDTYVRVTLSRKYGANDYTQNSGYLASNGSKYPGIGLAQWTGGGAMKLLNTAEAVHAKWWKLNFQLAYMLAKNAPTGAFGKKFWSEYKSQPNDATFDTIWFAKYFEGNTTMVIVKRCILAEGWLQLEKHWTVNEKYGNSVLNMAKKIGFTADDGAMSKQLSRCVRAMNYDNHSLASAFVSYAYETVAEARGNDGTPLYQRLHKAIFPGDPEFQSCDRAVAVAVRWSGTDIDFPVGPSEAQLPYMSTSKKWKKVGDSGSITMDQLKPGDIFCLNGHIFMYVGHKAVAAKYPKTRANIDTVAASWHQYSPACSNDSNDIVIRRHGQDWINRGEYHIFRCVKSDHSSKYKSLGAGAN